MPFSSEVLGILTSHGSVTKSVRITWFGQEYLITLNKSYGLGQEFAIYNMTTPSSVTFLHYLDLTSGQGTPNVLDMDIDADGYLFIAYNGILRSYSIGSLISGSPVLIDEINESDTALWIVKDRLAAGIIYVASDAEGSTGRVRRFDTSSGMFGTAVWDNSTYDTFDYKFPGVFIGTHIFTYKPTTGFLAINKDTGVPKSVVSGYSCGAFSAVGNYIIAGMNDGTIGTITTDGNGNITPFSLLNTSILNSSVADFGITVLGESMLVSRNSGEVYVFDMKNPQNPRNDTDLNGPGGMVLPATGNKFIRICGLNETGLVYSGINNLGESRMLSYSIRPKIITQPQSQTKTVGQSVVFSVDTDPNAASPALLFQWRKNGSPISGATTQGYSISSVTLSDVADYSVEVTENGGAIFASIISDNAHLTVNSAVAAPVITTQPVSQVSIVGQTATFSVVATGTDLSYQWKRNGVNVGTNSNIFTTPTLLIGDNGASYTVVVSNAGGSVTSNAAVLTVNAAGPTITLQPVSVSVVEGLSAVFTVAGSGTAPLTYQWYKNNVLISGETLSSLTIDPTSTTDAGNYKVTITDINGSVTSNVATLTVTLLAPSITLLNVSPSSTRNVGQSVTFTVSATTGSSPLSYQWKKNGTTNVGTNSNVFTIPSLVIGDDADYSVVVSSAAGSVTSSIIHLTVTNVSVTITTQPQPITGVLGATGKSFSVIATGTAPLTYQWKKNGVNVSGATNSTLSFAGLVSTDMGEYTVVITNPSGSITSNPTNLSIDYPLTSSSSNTTIPLLNNPGTTGTDTLVINKGAIPGTTPVNISITETTNVSDPLTSPNFMFFGRTYDLEPNGLQFVPGKTVKLSLKYTQAEFVASGLASESLIKIYYFDTVTSTWVAVPTSVNTTTNVATATITHFTQYSIGVQEVVHVGGDIFADLSATELGNGTQVSPYTIAQLESFLSTASYLDSNLTIYLNGDYTVPANTQVNFSTPYLTDGLDLNSTVTFKRVGPCVPCAHIFSNSGSYSERSLILIGGGSFKTTFADVEVLVTGSLNNKLEGILEVIGDNEVIVDNDALVGNFLTDFAMGAGSSCGCGCCCVGTQPIYFPLLANDHTSTYSNTWVTHLVSPEVLEHPVMGKFVSFVDNQIILGNAAYTYYVPTTLITKTDGNYFHGISNLMVNDNLPELLVSVIDNYETDTLHPEVIADHGDFEHVHPLVNVLGTTLATLDLEYGPDGIGHGLNNTPVMSQLNDNYPGFSFFGNVDAGFSCEVFFNTPPTINEIPDATIFENVLFTYTAVAGDLEGNFASPKFSLEGAPIGMVIDGSTGVITWTPDIGVTTSGLVTVKVCDTCGQCATEEFTLTVRPNTAPVITEFPVDGLICGGSSYGFTMVGVDGEANFASPKWTITGPGAPSASNPNRMTINPSTGVISWLPATGVTTSGLVTVKLNDALGLFDTKTFTLTVNSAPVMNAITISNPICGSTFSYQVVATDVNSNITGYSLSGAPAGMSISSTGLITWTPVDGQTVSGLVTVRVTDGCGLYAERTFNVALNSAPVITSIAPTGLVCNTFSYTPTATDVDGNFATPKWTLTSAPVGMVINPSSGAISWTPASNITSSGLVTVRVTDTCGLYAEQSFLLTVNSAPVITSIAPTGPLTQTVLFTYAATATDVNGNLISGPWSLLSAPLGMIIDASTGVVSWLPPIGVTTSGVVTVKVIDACGKFTTQSFTLVVNPISNPPHITTTPSSMVCDCHQFVYEAHASYGTGTLVWSLVNPPVGMVVNPLTGRVTWTPGLCPGGHSQGGHSMGGHSHGGHSPGGHSHSNDHHVTISGNSHGHPIGHSAGGHSHGHLKGHSVGGHSVGGTLHDLCCGGVSTSGPVTLKVTDSLGSFDTQVFTVEVCSCIDFVPVEHGHSHGHSNDTHDFHGNKLRSNPTASGAYIQLTGNVYDIPAKFTLCEEPLNNHENTMFSFLNRTFHLTSTGPSILNTPLLLVIKYTDAELVSMGLLDENRVKGFVWNPTSNSWAYLKTEVDLANNTATIEINQLVGADYNLSKAPPVEVEITDIALYQPSLETLNVSVEFDAKDIDMDDINIEYKWKLLSEPDSAFKTAKITPPLNRISGTDNWTTYSILWDAKGEIHFANNSTSQKVVFRIIAHDDDGTTTIVNSTPFTIVLNTPPKITSNPKFNVNVGDVYTYLPSASDKENNVSYWQVSGQPSFLTFITSTGKLSGTATLAYVGTYTITLKVFDTQGAMDIQTFNLTIKNKK